MSGTTSVAASTLRMPGYVMMNGTPCKIRFVGERSGGTEIAVAGNDLWTGMSFQETFPAGQSVEVPNVTTREFTVFEVNEATDELVLKYYDGSTRPGKLPRELEGGEVARKILMNYMDGADTTVIVSWACGKEQITALKNEL